MRVPHDSLVLVADGRKRLFFRNRGDALAPELMVVEAAEAINPPTREHGTDAPGRASSPVGGGGSLAGADAHQIEEQRFAADTVAILCERAQRGDFESLIIVAPSKTLGELRKHYRSSLKDKLIGELSKDLTSHPAKEICAMLIRHGE